MGDVQIDIVGDVHGNLAPLKMLLAALGYDERDQWRHPSGRRLLFVGDLVDRGPASFEVAELVRSLCEGGEHLCLLGNHELNLVDWRRGRTGPKHSNRKTIAAIEADAERGAGRRSSTSSRRSRSRSSCRTCASPTQCGTRAASTSSSPRCSGPWLATCGRASGGTRSVSTRRSRGGSCATVSRPRPSPDSGRTPFRCS